MSDTPRTDKEAFDVSEGATVTHRTKCSDGAYVDADFARQLECEVAEQTRRAELGQQLLYRAKEREEDMLPTMAPHPDTRRLDDMERTRCYPFWNGEGWTYIVAPERSSKVERKGIGATVREAIDDAMRPSALHRE